MSGKTTYYTIDKFTKQGKLNTDGLECTIDNLRFRKGDSSSSRNIKEVIDTCKKYNNFSINTLIVRNEEILTIWIEQKPKENRDNAPVSSNDRAMDSQTSDRALPTKTITRRYRGQVYEETVIDWVAVQQSQLNKPRRKYRGQYIE